MSNYIKVKAVPDSKEEKIEKIKEDEYRVFTKAPAERNLANRRIIELLKVYFKTSNVRIVNGHTSPSKIFSVEN